MTIRKRPDPARRPHPTPSETNAGRGPAANRDPGSSSPKAARPLPGTDPVATGDGRPAGRTPRPPGSEGETRVPRSTEAGPGRARSEDPVSGGARPDRDDPPTGPAGPRPKTYLVDVYSVLDGLMDEDEGGVAEFRTFDRARRHAVDWLERNARDLHSLAAKLKEADGFADLDLGWHLPLLQECDDAED